MNRRFCSTSRVYMCSCEDVFDNTIQSDTFMGE